jgi:hypothetical protein
MIDIDFDLAGKTEGKLRDIIALTWAFRVWQT